MLAWELERVELGESLVGEKYDWPPTSPGEGAFFGMLVFTLKAGA